MKTDTDSHQLFGAVEAARARMLHVEYYADRCAVVMPLLYPSGGAVTVEVHASSSGWNVSDNAVGYYEATDYGVPVASYGRAIASLAREQGFEVVDHSIVARGVPAHALHVALALVADMSRTAVEKTIAALDDAIVDDRTERLYRKLVSTFSEREVAKNVEVKGASAHAWHIATRVQSGSRIAFFDPVAAHHASVASVVTKYHDLARLTDPPRRVSVIEDRQKLGDLVGVLSQASLVMESAASKSMYRESAGVH